jgi:hypothetical protein
VLRPKASFSRIQKHATKADHRRANKLSLSTHKLIGGSTHPTVPHQKNLQRFDEVVDTARRFVRLDYKGRYKWR